MAQEVSVIVRDDDRARLEAIVGDRNHSHKHVQRARIVLTAELERLRHDVDRFGLRIALPALETALTGAAADKQQ